MAAEGSLPPVIARLLLDGKQFSAGLATAKGEMEAMTGKGATAFQGLASVGKAALLGLAGAAVGVGVISVKMASTFQASMEKIHTQAQVPQAAIKGLSNAVLNLSGQVGVSADTLAQGLFHVESAFQSTGITGAKALEILKISAEGARIGGADLVDVTNALDAAIVSGIPGVQNYTQAMGALNAIVGSGDMTMQDLADAMGTGVLAVVKNYGLTLTDAGAALATFGDNNIRGATAATALRMAVQALAVPAKAGASILEKMGLSTTQLAVDMQHGGLVPALQDLKTHIEAAGYTSVQTGQILTQIFGKRAGVGVAVLYDQLDRLKSKYGDITAASKNFGDAWAETQKTVKQEGAQLVQTVEALAIRIGLWLIPKLEDLARVTMSVVQWFEKHQTVALALGVAIGSVLVAAIGAYIVSMVMAAAATIAATWPVLAVMAAIGALATGLVYAYTHWQAFRDIVDGVWRWMQQDLWPGLKDFATWLGTAFSDPLKAASDAFSGIQDVWHGLFGGGKKTVAIAVTSTAQDLGRAAAHGSVPLPSLPMGPPSMGPQVVPLKPGQMGPPSIIPQLMGPPSMGPQVPPMAPSPSLVAQAWRSVYSAMAPIVSNIADFVGKQAEKIAQFWDSHSQEIKAVSKAVWEAIVSTVRTNLDILNHDILQPALKVIEKIWRPAWEILQHVLSLVWVNIQFIVSTSLDILLGILSVGLDLLTGHWSKAWKDLKQTFVNLWNDIKTYFAGLWDDLFAIGRNLIKGIIAGIGAMANAFWNVIGDIGNRIISAFKNVFGISSPSTVMASQVGVPIVQGIIHGALSMVGSLIGFFVSIPDRIVNAFGDVLGRFADIGVRIVQAIIGGLGSMAGNLGSAVVNLVSGASGKGKVALPEAVGSLIGGPSNNGGGLKVAKLASGGRITGPMLALLGEGGEKETVIPDSMWEQWSKRGNVQPLSSGFGSSSGGGDQSVTLNIALQVDGRTFAATTVRYTWAELLRLQRGTVNLGFK